MLIIQETGDNSTSNFQPSVYPGQMSVPDDDDQIDDYEFDLNEEYVRK